MKSALSKPSSRDRKKPSKTISETFPSNVDTILPSSLGNSKLGYNWREISCPRTGPNRLNSLKIIDRPPRAFDTIQTFLSAFSCKKICCDEDFQLAPCDFVRTRIAQTSRPKVGRRHLKQLGRAELLASRYPSLSGHFSSERVFHAALHLG